ncbi:MFS transporter [Homoserinimonas sp. OAct 916]|uniref:MFS transporter n=1 Tax=Homoserinimonas sp. OAct 916 TaxID=2211450 RepID=UPI000DBE1A6A|nr:MFS transporter [Homoserinimonas sp. OAct 916]
MKYTFRSLRFFNYRLWATGAIISNTGTWMQRVAQDWLVLTVLTDNSAVAVGITTGLQFGPILVLAPLAGVISDRYSKRAVLMITQIAFGLTAAAVGILVLSGHAQLWQIYLAALLLGVITAIDSPARQTFVSEMVPLRDLPNAVGLNSASFNAARLIGPGVAGLLIAGIGIGWVFVINAATFAAVLVSLTRMRMDQLEIIERPARAKGTMRAGVRYVRNRPDIVLILVIVGMVGAFGLNFQMTTALIARVTFDRGAAEYGLLGSIMAVGSLAGALLAARRDNPRMRLVIGSALAFGVFSSVAALMPTYWTFAIALIPVGVTALTLVTAANSTVQMTVSPAMRGRVMALYMAIFMGTTPVGAPIVGWIGEAWGPRWTILFGGLVSIVTALGALYYLMRSKRIRIGYDSTARLRLALVPSKARLLEEAQQKLAAQQAQNDASSA